jgi:hypothetical protein
LAEWFPEYTPGIRGWKQSLSTGIDIARAAADIRSAQALRDSGFLKWCEAKRLLVLALTLPPSRRAGEREYCENTTYTAQPAGGDVGCRRWRGRAGRCG